MTQDFRTTKRRWIKLYPGECINGSIRYQLTPSERGVWYDLLSLSSLCSNTGDICDRDGKAFPLTYIANRLNIRLPLLKATIEECTNEGRLTQDEHGLHITNWDKYQSEYDRQKPYRKKRRLFERIKEAQEAGDVEVHGHVRQEGASDLETAHAYGFDTVEEWDADEEANLICKTDEERLKHETAMLEQNPELDAALPD